MIIVDKIKAFYKDKKEDFDWYMEDLRADIKRQGVLKTLWEIVRNAFHRNVRVYFRKFVKIAQWIPVLWADEDWDYRHIITMLKYKLQRTRKEIKNGYGDDEQWIKPRCAEIDEVINLLTLLENDDFAEEEHLAHTKKYGNIKFSQGEKTDRGTISCELNFESSIKPDGSIDAVIDEEARQENHKVFQLEEKRRQEAYDKAFALISKNIRGWWD